MSISQIRFLICFLLADLLFLGTIANAAPPSGSLAKYGHMRTWTSRLGANKVEGKLLEVTERVLTIERSDGVKLEVELDKLSTEDQAFVQEFLDKSKPVTVLSEDEQKKRYIEEGKVTAFKWQKREMLEPSPFKSFWNAQNVSPIRLTPPDTRSVPISIQKSATHQLFVAGSKPTAWMCSRDRNTLFGTIQFPDGLPTLIGISGNKWMLLSVSPNAKRGIAVTTHFPRGESIAVFQRAEDHMDTIVLARDEGSKTLGAAFLQDEKIVTLAASGHIDVWDLVTKRRVRAAHFPNATGISVGGRGEIVGVTSPGRIAFFDGNVEHFIGLIRLDTVENPAFAFCPDGKRIAVSFGSMVCIYNLADGKLSKQIPVSSNLQRSTPIIWLGDYLLVDESILIDTTMGIPVWSYRIGDAVRADPFAFAFGPGFGEPQLVTSWAGQLYAVFLGNDPAIATFQIPEPEALKTIAETPRDAMLATYEGMEYSIESKISDVDADTKDTIIEAISKAATSARWVQNANADNVITIIVEKKDAVTVAVPSAPSSGDHYIRVNYQPSRFQQGNRFPGSGPGMRPGIPNGSNAGTNQPNFGNSNDERAKATPIECTVRLTVKGKRVLSSTQYAGMYGIWKEGEALQVFFDRIAKPDLEFFQRFKFPTEMIFEENQRGIGHSILNKDGTVVTHKTPESQVLPGFGGIGNGVIPELPLKPQRRKRTESSSEKEK